MFKNITIGMKISLGFAILILIITALGIMSLVVMEKAAVESSKLSEELIPNVDIAMDLRGDANRLMYEMLAYSETEDAGYYESAWKKIETMTADISEGRALAATAGNLTSLASKLDEIEASLGDSKALMEVVNRNLNRIESAREVLDESAGEIRMGGAAFVAIDEKLLNAALAKRWAASNQNAISKEVSEAYERIALANEIRRMGAEVESRTLRAQALDDVELLRQLEEAFDQIEENFQRLKDLTSSKEGLALIDAGDAAIRNFKSAVDDFKTDWESVLTAKQSFEKAGEEMIDVCKSLADQGMEKTDSVAEETSKEMAVATVVIIIGLIVALAVGCTMAFVISRGITTAIKRIVFGLRENAEQVASAAGQISAASQVLAEGASEQASSIEETSSTLEEMSAMTRQNAGNAGEADSLVKQSAMVIDAANDSMEKLTVSMKEISEASAETSKIIKTIDEIAFQTNLLALNAAVEAARAGVAGAGFAVVADEVRNLAMRAAEAAKNTSGLIEATGKKIEFGGRLVAQTNEAFSDVFVQASKVGGLVGEIAIASKEQSEGIGQVNDSVGEMDKVVQKNAANAEESASAAEEMNAMVEQMNGIVQTLVGMVGGGALKIQGGKERNLKGTRQYQSIPERGLIKIPAGKESRGKKMVIGHREVSQEQIIKMDDGFSDF